MHHTCNHCDVIFPLYCLAYLPIVSRGVCCLAELAKLHISSSYYLLSYTHGIDSREGIGHQDIVLSVFRALVDSYS